MKECDVMETNTDGNSSKNYKKKLLELQSIIEIYDKVILISYEEKAVIDIMTKFERSNAMKHTKKQIVILSTVEWDGTSNLTYKKITPEESSALLNLYYMYEFSDKFQVLSSQNNFGTLINFYNTGLLNLEEAFEAILA